MVGGRQKVRFLSTCDSLGFVDGSGFSDALFRFESHSEGLGRSGEVRGTEAGGLIGVHTAETGDSNCRLGSQMVRPAPPSPRRFFGGLDTGSSSETLARLLRLEGVLPAMLASSGSCLEAQRSVRSVCLSYSVIVSKHGGLIALLFVDTALLTVFVILHRS